MNKSLHQTSMLRVAFVLIFGAFIGFSSFAQFAVTPPFEVSACNTDSMTISFTNSLGSSATVGDTASIRIILPGGGLIKYDSGSIVAYNYDAATASGYSDTVDIKFPLQPVGRTIKIKLDLHADCDVPSLASTALPVINGVITYPSGYAIPSESVTTAEFNCVAAQLVLQPSSSNINLSVPKERASWRVIPIFNGGYGNIDEFTIVDTSDAEIVFIDATQRLYLGASGNIGYESITFTSETLPDGRIVRTYLVTKDMLGTDELLVPNEIVRLYQRIRLDTCAQYNSSITTYFKCDDDAPICGSPDYVKASIIANGGNPNVRLVTLQADSADGCPNKHIELAYLNAGQVFSGTNPLSNANNLKLKFEFKNQIISNLLLNGQTVTYTETDGLVEIDLAQFNSAFGPLTSFEMDGIYNDLPVGDSLYLEFDYTTNCFEACGADAFSQLMNKSSYEDLCGFEETKDQNAYEFGFKQLSPVSNDPPVNYTYQGDGTYDTLTHEWAMDYEAINYKLDGVTGELIIRFAKNMNFDASSVKLNGTTLTPTVYNDSAVVSLTNAQVVAFLNAGRDTLEYATELLCDTLQFSSGATGLTDNFSFILNLDGNGSCTPGCALDLTCNTVTGYGYDGGCGTGCVYDQDSLIVGREFSGSTSPDQATDTIASNNNMYSSDTLMIRNYYTTKANALGSRTESRLIWSPTYTYSQTDISMMMVPPFLFIDAVIIVNGTDTLPFDHTDRQNASGWAYDYDSYTPTYDHFFNVCAGAPSGGTCFGNTFQKGIQFGGGISSWPSGPNFGYRVWSTDTTFHRFNNQINVNQAIERAGLTVDYFQAGNTFDFIARYIPNPDFNWETVGNINFTAGLTSYTKQTTNNHGSCNSIVDNINIINPEVYITNPFSTYNNDCGLSVNHDIEYEGFNGDYFPNEYRFPYRIDSVVMDIPTEYGIVSGSDSFYNHIDGTGQWNQPGAGTFSRSAANGHVVWAGNLADGYFPKSDDEASYQMPIRLNYDLEKLGTAADSSYTIPVTFYGKDDYGHVKIYYDTIKVTEDEPVLVITPISPLVTVADGGDCEETYIDYQVCNNSIYTAKNLFLAAESFNGTTINRIEDLGTVSFNPLQTGVDTAYGVNKLYQPLGTLREGECRDVRVFANIYDCSDSIRLYADYGCEYPSPRMPDYASNTIDSGTGEFNTFSPGLQTKTAPLSANSTYCDNISAVFEILNTKLPNLYDIETEIEFPAGIEIVASSLDYQYDGGPWRAVPVAAVDRGAYVGGNYQDSALINWDQVTSAEFNGDCGLPGSDENPMNSIFVRCDFEFTGCLAIPTTILYKTRAETFCGVEVGYQSVSNLLVIESETPNPKNDFAITSSVDSDLTICNELNDAQTMFDTLTIENLGGYGIASGTTNGSDSIEIQLPNNGLSFTIANISVNDAAFGTPRIYTSVSGGQVAKMLLPSGIAVNGTIDLPLQYDMTLLNFNYCGLVSPYQAKIYTYNSSGCVAKAIVCSETETVTASEVIDRVVDCCEIEVGNFVWLDANGDGVQDADEMGLGGITVELYDDMGVLVATTTTDANGGYSFNRTEDGMMPGEQYEVRIPTAQDTISDLSSTVTGSGTGENDNNGVSGGGGTYTTSGLFTAPDGVTTDVDTTIDFGFIGYSIGNTVWWDDNNDGVKGPNEEGISGVKMYLLDDAGNVIDSTVTDANGAYVFEGLMPGDYQVAVADDNSGGLSAESNVSGNTNTTADTDDNNDGSATDPVGNTSIAFKSISNTITLGGKSEPTDESDEDPNSNVPDNQSNMSVDFGFYNNITIGDYVWLDSDADGVQDPDEMGIAGVRVELYDSLGNFITFTTTDADGKYEFTTENDSIVPSAKYEIRIPNAQTTITDLSSTGTGSGTGESDNNGTSGGGGSYTTSGDIYTPDRTTGIDTSIDFGFIGYSIGNTVWWDNDNDGIQDAGEIGIAGVLMYLIDDAGNIVDSTTTDASGNYLFDGLLPGDYQVAVASSLTSGTLDGAGVSGTTNTTADVDGNNDGSATDPVGNTAATFSSISNTITLGGKSEPTDENDEDPNTNQPDNQSNLTVDFGFTPPITAVGNYIFHDIDSNGVNNGADSALAGVKVYLYQDLDGDGTPETLMDSVLSDANGFYQFDSLGAGNFQLVLAPDNFVPGGPLETGSGTTNGNSGDNSTDNNSEGSSSGIFTLTPNGETTSDANDDAASNFDDDDANFTFDFGIKSDVSGGPVPVAWLYFTAEKLDDSDVILDWSTASELNNSGFEIHKSTDEGQTFEVIDFVDGQGTTSSVSTYIYVDRNVNANEVGQLCYRLNQVDYDGASDMTDIECVDFDQTTQTVVYPNPATDVVNVEFTRVAANATVEIRTTEGKLLESKDVKADEACTFDVASLESGVYMISITDGGKTTSKRVIINH